ncbi:MAG TPA: group III truncated hemoglobin [Verrucomicrobiae bacterium]|jgi:hemoglobin|nr:group III truncated hemoglobin [Verrucomicrobiae bacterium]
MEKTLTLFLRIGGRAGLMTLLHHFYADVRQHQTIGPIFNSQIKNWPEHIETIADFWSQITGGPAGYAGRMPERHLPFGLREEHFQAWLDLWDFNCRRQLAPAEANELTTYARQIGQRLLQILQTKKMDEPSGPGS